MRIANEIAKNQLLSQEQPLIDWLLEGDPAIRWQVMRDLLEEDLGLWGGGIYGPKWISTTYTMLTLRRLGLPAANEQAQKGCQLLLERGFYRDGGINYFKSLDQSEVCVTGMVLSILAHFRYQDPRLDDLADHLLDRQMADWGWNCEDYKGDRHSSFHTTMSALEGLHEYQKARERIRIDVESARLRGHEFLLQHRLFRSDHTGEIVNDRMLRMPFPPRWFYDFLRALDYFQDYFSWRTRQEINYSDQESEDLYVKHEKDERFLDSIELLKKKRKSNGKWNMMRGPSGKTYFNMEQAGKPGRWNTLRALRVLKWWEGEL
jgi:hypothetical protein